MPSLSVVGEAGLWMRRLGSGEGRNSSIRSVSGTGSISAVGGRRSRCIRTEADAQKCTKGMWSFGLRVSLWRR